MAAAAAAVCSRNAYIFPAASLVSLRKPCKLHSTSSSSNITSVSTVLPPYFPLLQNSRHERLTLSSPSSRNENPLPSKFGQIKCFICHQRSRNGTARFLRLPLAVSAMAMLQSSLIALTWFRRIWACGGIAGAGQPLRQGGLGMGMALLSTSAIAKAHISPVLLTLRSNPTFMSGLLAWAIAQLMKIFTTYFVERRWDFKMVLGSGGMPSSHAALCVGLTTAVALCHGVGDSLFPVCLGFSLIVMYDATGVRRHAGMQAEVLNMIVKDLFQGHPVSQKKLKELLGHTPLQVLAGACLGMLIGYWCSTVSTRSLT